MHQPSRASGRRDADKAKAAAGKQPVGLPEPNIWTGAAEQKLLAANTKHANVPQQNYAPFAARAASIPMQLEPPKAQQIHAVLDTVMASVLTDPDANPDELLATATPPDWIDSTVDRQLRNPGSMLCFCRTALRIRHDEAASAARRSTSPPYPRACSAAPGEPGTTGASAAG